MMSAKESSSISMTCRMRIGVGWQSRRQVKRLAIAAIAATVPVLGLAGPAYAQSSPNLAALDRLCGQISTSGQKVGFFDELGRAFTKAPGLATNHIVRSGGGSTSTVTANLTTDKDMNVRTMSVTDGVVTVSLAFADGTSYQRTADSVAQGDLRYDNSATWQVSTGAPRTLNASPWVGKPVVKAGKYLWRGTEQSSSDGSTFKITGTTTMSKDCHTIKMDKVAREYKAGKLVSATRIKIWAEAKDVPDLHAPTKV